MLLLLSVGRRLKTVAWSLSTTDGVEEFSAPSRESIHSSRRQLLSRTFAKYITSHHLYSHSRKKLQFHTVTFTEKS